VTRVNILRLVTSTAAQRNDYLRWNQTNSVWNSVQQRWRRYQQVAHVCLYSWSALLTSY